MANSRQQVDSVSRTLLIALAVLLPVALAFTSTAGKQTSPLISLASHESSTAAEEDGELSRRSFLMGTPAAGILLSSFALGWSSAPQPALAKPDCLQDCVKNCKQVVPNDTSNYCTESCLDYCAQDDRRDGLSGSVSSEGGEVGILGGTFGQGTVVKGQDKPPAISLPGLNFESKEGKKLLG
ncbi:expressed unknown protein [Seminavis robusta]|uniref:Uncharacterized protein n=1 Tax=Seminavis robusta TaxID=568900 RepID=A0A9N8H7Q0_9STRA|nr:expressed unknown protein [Seminavis robusta]|eukprot:Sro211_g087930.1 n/a (182) ;mRNA; r:43467-44012